MNPSINHIAIYVYDLQKSSSFYKNIMQFEKIDEPFKDGRHDWYKIGEHSQLHIISGNIKDQSHEKNVHLAFTVPSLDKFIAHLEKEKINFSNWAGDIKGPNLRPDGIKQIYFQDPDGYWIEVNDDKY